MSRFARPILNLVIAGGLVLAAWPLGQTVYAQWNQRQLAAQWERDAQIAPQIQRPSAPKKVVAKSVSSSKTNPSADNPTLPVVARSATKPAWPATKLSIPDIGLETFIVQGWDDATLRRGPGHLPSSSMPGAGNCVIAGHRNVYGSHFYRIDELLPGASIVLESRRGRFVYTVNSIWTTPDSNVGILQPPAPDAPALLTLVTCTLPHTNNRVILQATLSETG